MQDDDGWRPEKWVWWEIVREQREANKAGDRGNELRPRLVVHHYHESRDQTILESLFGSLFPRGPHAG